MAVKNHVEIKAQKGIMIIILLLALYLTYGFLENIYHRISGHGIASALSIYKLIVNSALAVIPAVIAFHVGKRMFDGGPGLVVNQQGIIDNSGLVPAGAVSWDEVDGISTNKVFFSDAVSIKVRNPYKYVNNHKSWFKRMWLEREIRKFGTSVNISGGGLKIKYNDLFNLIQQHYLSAKVETRTLELKREKDVIQQEKKELVDSINYAKRIQTALLPSSSIISQRLGESFILFIPKDIVSGDFYWVEIVGEWVFFAVCDCTGHGVPGALISIVCNNALNRAVKEYGIVQPSKILDKVSELIVESIGLDGEVKDGMDASVCAFNKDTRELYWSGANLPLWIARQTTFYELLEFKPDKQPIGLFQSRTPYTNHKIIIEKGDILYLFSDGYADQFGGEQGKKLTRKKFKELVLKQRGISLQQQHTNLLNFHSSYKMQGDQIDDILVMGVRVEQ